MANIVLNAEKKIEAGAEAVLKFLTRAQAVEQKFGPATIAALGVLLGAFSKAVGDVASASQEGGINISLDFQTVSDIKAVWPDIEAFAKSLGITL